MTPGFDVFRGRLQLRAPSGHSPRVHKVLTKPTIVLLWKCWLYCINFNQSPNAILVIYDEENKRFYNINWVLGSWLSTQIQPFMILILCHVTIFRLSATLNFIATFLSSASNLFDFSYGLLHIRSNSSSRSGPSCPNLPLLNALRCSSLPHGFHRYYPYRTHYLAVFERYGLAW